MHQITYTADQLLFEGTTRFVFSDGPWLVFTGIRPYPGLWEFADLVVEAASSKEAVRFRGYLVHQPPRPWAAGKPLHRPQAECFASSGRRRPFSLAPRCQARSAQQLTSIWRVMKEDLRQLGYQLEGGPVLFIVRPAV